MKHIITTIILALSFIFLIAQTDTTYYLTTGEVSVFAFESEPSFLNVSTAEIMLEKKDNKVMLLPQDRFSGATLVAEIESKFYKIKLDWTNDKSRVAYFQDFRENSLDDCVAPVTAKETSEKRYVEGKKNIITKEVLKRVSEKLSAFRNHNIDGTKLYNSKDINDGFQANLVVGFVDEDHFYFKFRLKNKQSIIYDLNPVRLSYESKQKTNLFKDDAIYKVEVKPTIESSDIKNVTANNVEFYYLAIPLFALNNKGKLKVNFTERNGMRDVTVTIFSHSISNLKYVGNDYEIINLESQTKN